MNVKIKECMSGRKNNKKAIIQSFQKCFEACHKQCGKKETFHKK